MRQFESLDIKEFPVTKEDIDQIYKTKDIKFTLHLYPGQSALLKATDANSSVLVLKLKDGYKILTSKGLETQTFCPKDRKQLAYYHTLRQEFDMVVALGPAGTGKTTLAISKSIDAYFRENKTIYLTKPTHMVQSHHGQAFGPVPGDVDEKYAPYINSFEIVLKKVLGDTANHYLQMMKDKNHLNFMPVEFTRGCTFEDCTFIIDEVQNLTWHELKTVLSRIGNNAQIIMCGDPYQIDAGFSQEESGIYQLLTSPSFAKSDFTSYIGLTKQYRGKIPALIYEIDKEKDDLLNKF